MAARTALAIDIGGTKVAAGVVSTDGDIEWSGRHAVPRTGDPRDVWDAVATLVDKAPPGWEVCGVGCVGPMTAGGALVSPVNIPAWRSFPLRRHLERLTGLEVWIDNDAKALALAEGWRGAAVGERDYLSMVVSTGVGGGIVLDGRLLEGAGGNAGHVGHVIVEPDGRICGCGAQGCLEAEASGTAIAAVTGLPPSEAGPAVRRRTGTLVGRAVASVANLLDLPLAAVGGSVALGYAEEFFAAAQEEIACRARLEFSSGCRIVPTGLGPDGPVLGAAAVAWRAAGRLAL